MVVRGPGTSLCVAVGALVVSIVLLSGFSAASADELSDLRTDRQLLQQQLDRLQGAAQPLPPGATPPARQPPIVGGSFPRSFVIPGTDTSVSVSGSVQSNFGFGFSH